MELPNYMTPSQFIQARTGADAELILSLLASVQALKTALDKSEALVAELQQANREGR